ncbi:hypothetical protein [Kitasatospora griseola]|uniref:hypothetical protein n=1 Tax=Kitasatospora griseola TaxID=2064 RepID=UPI0034455593
MSTPYNGLEHQVSRLARSVDDVESTVRQLREDQEMEHGEVTSRLDSAEYKLREQGEAVDTLDERTDEHDDDIKELRTQLKDLGQRVAWLERRVRTAAGGDAVDLDATDPQIDQLVTKAAAGRAAEARLLPAAERARHTQQLRLFDEAAAALEQARNDVLAATGTLATAAQGSKPFDAATAAYRQAATRLKTATAQADRLRPGALAARAALTRDEDLDHTLAKAAEAGEHAYDQLLHIARDRIRDAVSGTGLLPVWFTTALGPMPPRTGTDDWLDAATDALAYRLLYGVRDEVLALGDIPAQATARQRADRKEAEQGLRP